MSLNYVSLVITAQDAGNDPGAGGVVIAPTSAVVAAGQTVVSAQPVTRQLSSGTVTVSLVATDNAGTAPAAGFWAYEITLPGGQPQLYLLPFSGGATQQLANLTPVTAQTTYGPAAATGMTNPMTTLGDLIYENATPAAARLAGDTTGTRKFLRGQASGGVAQAPAWDTLQLGDVPAGVALLAGATYTGPVAPAVFALTDAATILVDASLGNVATVTLAGNRTMGNPSNATRDGQILRFRITQDATGGRTLTWGTAYDFGSGTAPSLTATASKTDILAFEYAAGLAKWCYLGAAIPQGF